MSPQRPSQPSAARQVAVDAGRTLAVLAAGLLAIAVLSAWHRLVASMRSGERGGAPASATDAVHEAAVVEHELDWYHYVKAFDAHHGPGGGPDRDIRSGSFFRGLRAWLGTRCLRGYTLGDDVYVCPTAPRVLRVHQAGHAPSFGSEFPTLVRPRRADGGLEDAPLRTLDVMLPGAFPHTFLRLRDPRGLEAAYDEWLRDGRIVRVGGA